VNSEAWHKRHRGIRSDCAVTTANHNRIISDRHVISSSFQMTKLAPVYSLSLSALTKRAARVSAATAIETNTFKANMQWAWTRTDKPRLLLGSIYKKHKLAPIFGRHTFLLFPTTSMSFCKDCISGIKVISARTINMSNLPIRRRSLRGHRRG
jgi:hypothetical protein